MLRSLYLRGRPDYLEAEQEANRALFDRHVRLVYGGGARNNAELFIPVCESPAACSWERRPSYEEIVGYREGAFLQALVESPGVGLIFIKKNNEAFTDGAPLPARLEVEIRDREGNRGLLSVERNDPSGELVYHYRTDPASANDPLGYEAWGAGEGTYGTYNEWNDRTIDLSYVNVVGGMGAYLYSSNPAIGDVVVLHASDWNFGENAAGTAGCTAEKRERSCSFQGRDSTRVSCARKRATVPPRKARSSLWSPGHTYRRSWTSCPRLWHGWATSPPSSTALPPTDSKNISTLGFGHSEAIS